MHDDHDTDDLDFAMLTPPTRPGPCKAATAPEVDPVERRLERECEAAPHVAEHYRMGDEKHNREVFIRRMAERGLSRELAAMMADNASAKFGSGVEVRHGSGKVKV